MDPNMRVLQAMRVGGTAKRVIERVEDVLEADVHLELLLPCNMLDSADLLPLHMQLHPRPESVTADGNVGGRGAVDGQAPPHGVPSGRRRRERRAGAGRG